MCSIEQTGVRGYDEHAVYSITDLNEKQIQILREGVELIRTQIVNSNNQDKLSYLDDCNKLLTSISQK